MLTKKDIVKMLETIAVYMEIKGENPFKVSAYRKASQSLETDERTIQEIDDVTTLKGIGKGVGDVINEYLETGKQSYLDELKEEILEGLIPLLKIPGLGSKKVAKLYKELNIKNIDSDSRNIKKDGMFVAIHGFETDGVEYILSLIHI